MTVKHCSPALSGRLQSEQQGTLRKLSRPLSEVAADTGTLLIIANLLLCNGQLEVSWSHVHWQHLVMEFSTWLVYINVKCIRSDARLWQEIQTLPFYLVNSKSLKSPGFNGCIDTHTCASLWLKTLGQLFILIVSLSLCAWMNLHLIVTLGQKWWKHPAFAVVTGSFMSDPHPLERISIICSGQKGAAIVLLLIPPRVCI